MSVVHVACPAFPKVHLRGWGCAWERACTCVTNFVPLCPRPGFLFSAASGSVESPRARDGLVLWECALNFNSRFGNLDGWGRISEVLRRDSGVLSLWPLRAAGPRAPSGHAPVDPPPTAAGQSPQLLRNPPWKSSPRWVRSTGALPSPGLSFPSPPKRTAQGLGGKRLGRWGRGRLAQRAREESAAHSLLLHGGGDFRRRLCQVRADWVALIRFREKAQI